MPDVKEQVNRVGLVFNERGLEFEHVDEFDNPIIALMFGGGELSYSNVAIHLIFDEDGESAQVLTSPIASVPVERTSRMLLVLNDCNRRFRWMKFYLDEDNDVIADGDVSFDELNAGEACFDIVMRAASIIDDVYADIMKGVWG